LMNQKHKLEEMQSAVQEDKEEAEKLRDQLQEERQKLKEQEQNLLRETRARLIHEGDELQKETRDAMDELKKNKSKEKLEQAQKTLAAMREQLKGPVWQPTLTTPDDKVPAGFAVGDRVLMRGMNLQGTVVSQPDSLGQLEIQVVNTKVKLAPENLENVETSASGQSVNISALRSSLSQRKVGLELDLRGKRADEVEVELDVYLNDASLANLSEVRIIHGIGTGTVKRIVRQYLASHPLVNSFRSGKREEGGDGVTIVKL
jgi:DNA mismatch repair protein MutS2